MKVKALSLVLITYTSEPLVMILLRVEVGLVTGKRKVLQMMMKRRGSLPIKGKRQSCNVFKRTIVQMMMMMMMMMKRILPL
eukprot:scaffold138352_cov56-Cyclotella_meneghiniana.AAC.1